MKHSHAWIQPWFSPVLAGLLILPLLGCPGSASKTDNLAQHKTSVSVHLVGDPSDDYKHVNLFIAQVQVKAKGDWQALASPGRVFDLQKPGCQEEPIAKEVRLERGDYDDLRITVDPARSSVELPDGTTRPLGLAEGLKAGIPLRVTEGPSPTNLVYDLILNIDAGRSIHRKGDSYTFVPVARLNDRSALGSVSGRLVDAHKQPLRNVQVMAQEGEGGSRTLVRTVRTGADGTYRLDLLPIRRMYYVVAQPRTGGLFAAQASPGFKPTRLDRKAALDFAPFQPAAEGAGPELAIQTAGAAYQYDVADLLQVLPTGDRTGIFTVRSAPIPALPPGEKSSFRFGPVPAGKYEVRITRITLSPQDGLPYPHPLGQQAVEVKPGEPARTLVF